MVLETSFISAYEPASENPENSIAGSEDESTQSSSLMAWFQVSPGNDQFLWPW